MRGEVECILVGAGRLSGSKDKLVCSLKLAVDMVVFSVWKFQTRSLGKEAHDFFFAILKSVLPLPIHTIPTASFPGMLTHLSYTQTP